MLQLIKKRGKKELIALWIKRNSTLPFLWVVLDASFMSFSAPPFFGEVDRCLLAPHLPPLSQLMTAAAAEAAAKVRRWWTMEGGWGPPTEMIRRLSRGAIPTDGRSVGRTSRSLTELLTSFIKEEEEEV